MVAKYGTIAYGTVDDASCVSCLHVEPKVGGTWAEPAGVEVGSSLARPIAFLVCDQTFFILTMTRVTVRDMSYPGTHS